MDETCPCPCHAGTTNPKITAQPDTIFVSVLNRVRYSHFVSCFHLNVSCSYHAMSIRHNLHLYNWSGKWDVYYINLLRTPGQRKCISNLGNFCGFCLAYGGTQGKWRQTHPQEAPKYSPSCLVGMLIFGNLIMYLTIGLCFQQLESFMTKERSRMLPTSCSLKSCNRHHWSYDFQLKFLVVQNSKQNK